MDVNGPGPRFRRRDQLASRYGGIDILVNNAGICTKRNTAEKVTDDLFECRRQSISTVRSGAVVPSADTCWTQSQVPLSTWFDVRFIVNNRGAVLLQRLEAAVHISPSRSRRVGRAGRARNAVAPTYVTTPLTHRKKHPPDVRCWIGGTPMARMGEVDEIASVVLFLRLTPQAWMTGSRRSG